MLCAVFCSLGPYVALVFSLEDWRSTHDMPVQAKRGGGGVVPTHLQPQQLKGVVCSARPPPSCFTHGKDLVPTVQAGWVLGPVWTETTLPPSGFSPHTVQAVARNYTDYAIPTDHTRSISGSEWTFDSKGMNLPLIIRHSISRFRLSTMVLQC